MRWYAIGCAAVSLIILGIAMFVDNPRESWTKPGYGKRRRTDGMKGKDQHLGE